MTDKLDARLDAVYRSIDTPLERIGTLTACLGRYVDEVVRGGRFEAATREDIWQATKEAASLLNRLAAVYRDISLIDTDAPRVRVDRDTGTIEIDSGCGVSLFMETTLFLHDEGSEAERLFRE